MEDPKVKKYLALLLALVMVFALAACGSTAETPAATEAPAAEPETPAEEPAAEADPMEDLIAAAKAEDEETVDDASVETTDSTAGVTEEEEN